MYTTQHCYLACVRAVINLDTKSYGGVGGRRSFRYRALASILTNLQRLWDNFACKIMSQEDNIKYQHLTQISAFATFLAN